MGKRICSVTLHLLPEEKCVNIYGSDITDQKNLERKLRESIEDLDTLGMQLVTSLVDQLDGELDLKGDDGTELIIRCTIVERNNQASVPAKQ